jgi:hypothetical protein
VTVDTELRRQLLHPGAGDVGGDELSDAPRVEALLTLLQGTLGPPRYRRLGQREQAPEAFYVVRRFE